jgi:hypothetical protein
MKNNKKNIISYSLWGDHPMYWEGALRNIEIVKEKLPNFICRFYIDGSSDQSLIDSIQESENVEKVIITSTEDKFHGMFWRFWAADDDDVDIMLSRDCDSRISDREIAAINEWINSDKDFHIMRDHPYHNVPILGGLWGCRNGILRKIGITEKTKKWGNYHSKGVDQDFLGSVIYPLVKGVSLEHDDYKRYSVNCKPFPVGRIEMGFVGEIYDENDVRNDEHWRLIK